MILYRVMSLEEFELFRTGETIRARDEVSVGRNSWRKPMMCFFGTSNNCAHWWPICTGKVIAAFDVRDENLLGCKGWGIYPDFEAAEQPSLTEVLWGVLTGAEINQPLVKVTEYALPFYSKRIATLRDWSYVWDCKYITFSGAGKVPRLAGYDDVIERLVGK